MIINVTWIRFQQLLFQKRIVSIEFDIYIFIVVYTVSEIM